MVSIITERPQIKRKKRSPAFPMAGKMKPFGLYPLWIHPVLPGETCQAITQKYSVVSTPLVSRFAGAWLENWFVYVKLTDLSDDLSQMFVSDTVSTSGYTASGDDPKFFVKSGQIDWVRLCTEAVHEYGFTHEGESARTIDGVPQVKLNATTWNQNMMFEPADEAVPTTDASDISEHLNNWMILQQMNMTEMSYEKYLETFGVRSSRVNRGDPEILRYHRKWTLPTNVVDPTTGAPSSAWFWNEDAKLDKAKRFDEPGFIISLGSIRPKMFNKHLAASMVGEMWGFSDWFPSYNLDDPTQSVKKIETDSALFHADSRTDGSEKTMLYDHRDLLVHGEQFINTDAPIDALPMSTGLMMEDASTPEDLRGEYATATDIDAMFTTETAAERYCAYDGIAMVAMSGHVKEGTPL